MISEMQGSAGWIRAQAVMIFWPEPPASNTTIHEYEQMVQSSTALTIFIRHSERRCSSTLNLTKRAASPYPAWAEACPFVTRILHASLTRLADEVLSVDLLKPTGRLKWPRIPRAVFSRVGSQPLR